MTLSQANKWAHIGNGEGVYMDFTKIALPRNVTVERFNNPDQITADGTRIITINFDMDEFVNPGQALVYGKISLALIGKNTVWALPDKYDFNIEGFNHKNKNYTFKTFIRDVATGFGAAISDFGWARRGIGFPIYFRGYQTIPDR